MRDTRDCQNAQVLCKNEHFRASGTVFALLEVSARCGQTRESKK